MPNQYGIDFDAVVENAGKDGIDLSEIALFYKDLTTAELSELKRFNLVVQETSETVIGRFSKEGMAIFPEKVTAVYTLSS